MLHLCAGDVLKVVDELDAEVPDIIVLDPPRDGDSSKGTGRRLCNFGVDETGVYQHVSRLALCARYLRCCREAGYRGGRELACVDMYS